MGSRREVRWGKSQKTGSALTCLVFVLMLGWTPVSEAAEPAGDDALLEKLHQKKILSDQEFEELKQREKAIGEPVEPKASAEPAEREKRIDKLLKRLEGLGIGALSYVDFSAGDEKDGKSFNRFSVTRGYINVTKELNSWLGFRVTPDAHQDDSGDFKLRLKYLYAELRPVDLGFITDIKSEIGIGHMPWLDFEEHINPYRVQGTMFIERADTFNSADVGVSIRGHFGGQLGEDYQEKVSHYYPGRWGSWHVGIYNGGGYHADEDNENKVPEYRVTVRPLPDMLPGLQLSYFGLYGQGNDERVGGFPDYRVNLGALSYQNEWITFTGQYARTTGNNDGSLVVNDTNQALRGEGYSLFFNTKLPVSVWNLYRKLNLFARHDHFDPDRKDRVTPGDDSYDLVHGGLAWEFYPEWLALLVYERIMYDENNGGVGKVPELTKSLDDDWRVQVALQIKI